jgi:mannose-6-phosphate isomerase-like protein (cupin superfamily)
MSIPSILKPFIEETQCMNEKMNPHYDWDKPENAAYRAEIAEYNRAYQIFIKGAPAYFEAQKKAKAYIIEQERKAAGPGIKAGVVLEKDWGTNEVLESRENENGITIEAKKKLVVNPGEALSLQQHRGREEEWYVESGVLTVICDGKIRDYHAGETAYLPKGKPHAMMNRGTEPVTVIETMKGICLESDNDRIMCPNGKAMVPCTTDSQVKSCAVYAEALDGLGHKNAHLFQAANTPEYREIVAKLEPSA